MLPKDFVTIQQIREYMKNNISAFSLSSVAKQNYTMYQRKCKNINCDFIIQYSYHQDGIYHLTKSCLKHCLNCQFDPNLKTNISNNEIIKIIQQIFCNRVPDIHLITDVLSTHGITVSKEKAKYLRNIVRLLTIGKSGEFLTKILDKCYSMQNSGWKTNQYFEMGMFTALRIIPPWTKNFLAVFSSPIMIDATFIDNNYKILILIGVDGENCTQILGAVITYSEDKFGYDLLLKKVKKYVGNIKITLISDMAKCIHSSAIDIFGENLNHIYCAFHVWENYTRKINHFPSHEMKISFFKMYRGELSIIDFLSSLANDFGEKSDNYKYFYNISDYLQIPESSGVFLRHNITTQRLEGLNAKIKQYSTEINMVFNSLIDHANFWYDNAIRKQYKENQILTDYAIQFIEDTCNDYINKCQNQDQDIYCSHVVENWHCKCPTLSYTGIPCPQVLLECFSKKINPSNFVSPLWHVETQKKAFKSDKLTINGNENKIILSNNDVIEDNACLIMYKTDYLFKHNTSFNKELNSLILKYENETVIPSISYLKKKTNDKKSRIILEHKNINKYHKRAIQLLKTYINSTKASDILSWILNISEHLHINISRDEKRNKILMLDWIENNYEQIIANINNISNN